MNYRRSPTSRRYKGSAGNTGGINSTDKNKCVITSVNTITGNC